jgi:hypothetical protein
MYGNKELQQTKGLPALTGHSSPMSDPDLLSQHAFLLQRILIFSFQWHVNFQ